MIHIMQNGEGRKALQEVLLRERSIVSHSGEATEPV